MRHIYFDLPALLTIIGVVALLASVLTVLILWMFSKGGDASPRRPSPGILRFAVFACVMLTVLAVNLVAQSVGPQTTVISGVTLQPLTYGRNIRLNVPSDTTHFVIVGPSPTNGLTNDQFDIFSGSQLLFAVGSNGAVGYGGYGQSNAIGQAQTNFGIQTRTFTSVTATSTNHFDFNPPYPYNQPPLVFIAPQGAAPGSNWVLSVSTNEAVITNNAGTANITAVAIGS